MNAVPHIDFPTLEELEKYSSTIPSYAEMMGIIRAEIEKGNVVVNIGDAGCMPHETIVVVDFAYEPMCEYEKIKVSKNMSAHPFKYLMLGDRKGNTSIDFGAWKHRMKGELSDEIQRRLDAMTSI